MPKKSNLMYAFGAAGLIAAFLFFLSETTPSGSNGGKPSLAESSLTNKKQPTADAGTSTVKVIEKELGIVMAGETQRCQFQISNNSKSVWVFQSLTPSCSCTVPSVSVNQIGPGESAIVYVEYKAPRKVADHTSKVHVRLNGKGSSDHLLQMHAHIRKPLTISPTETIELGVLAANSTKKVRFEVENFSSEMWSGIQLQRTQAIQATAEEIAVVQGTGEKAGVFLPKQVWRVAADLHVGKITPSLMQSKIQISATGSGVVYSQDLTFNYRSGSGILATPSKCFLGKLGKGEDHKEKLTLHLLSEDLAKNGTVRCQPPEVLIATIDRVHGRSVDVEVKLSIPADYPSGDFNGKLDFEFGVDSPATLTVPVVARIAD